MAWICIACDVSNSLRNINCKCGAPQVLPQTTGWDCLSCTLTNDEKAKTCEVCQKPRVVAPPRVAKPRVVAPPRVVAKQTVETKECKFQSQYDRYKTAPSKSACTHACMCILKLLLVCITSDPEEAYPTIDKLFKSDGYNYGNPENVAKELKLKNVGDGMIVSIANEKHKDVFTYTGRLVDYLADKTFFVLVCVNYTFGVVRVGKQYIGIDTHTGLQKFFGKEGAKKWVSGHNAVLTADLLISLEKDREIATTVQASYFTL